MPISLRLSGEDAVTNRMIKHILQLVLLRTELVFQRTYLSFQNVNVLLAGWTLHATPMPKFMRLAFLIADLKPVVCLNSLKSLIFRREPTLAMA